MVGTLVSDEFHPISTASLRLEEELDRLIRRKHGGSGAQLGSHVGNHVTIHGAQAVQGWAVIFDDLANTPINAMPA